MCCGGLALLFSSLALLLVQVCFPSVCVGTLLVGALLVGTLIVVALLAAALVVVVLFLPWLLLLSWFSAVLGFGWCYIVLLGR